MAKWNVTQSDHFFVVKVYDTFQDPRELTKTYYTRTKEDADLIAEGEREFGGYWDVVEITREQFY